jgi:hypothetical protein
MLSNKDYGDLLNHATGKTLSNLECIKANASFWKTIGLFIAWVNQKLHMVQSKSQNFSELK